ncbi:hypothetical protein K9U40_24380, partial [Xanthobacter autotrophicus]|nr:hypothetical protein [Xanthobacter autotrophicus]
MAGGSLGMAGAPCFAGMGAYRTGVGLVDLVVEEGSRPVVQTLLPEAIVHTWESFSEEGAAKACLEKASLVILGPGLGLKEESRIFFYQLWNTLKKMPRPLL